MKTVIATTTLYNNTDAEVKRLELACQMLQLEIDNGYPVVVLDGSLDVMFNMLSAIRGAMVYPLTVPGMGPGRRLAFFYALHHLHITLGQEDGVIFWTEPEKPGLVKWIDAITDPIISGQADAVIPKRCEDNFETYPDWQAEIEHAYNSVYEAETGRVGFDPAFGPVAFRASTLKKLLFWNPASVDLPDTYITHYLPCLIERVASAEVDCPYPTEQRKVEEKNKNIFYAKRILQRDTFVKAYQTLAKLPKLV